MSVSQLMPITENPAYEGFVSTVTGHRNPASLSPAALLRWDGWRATPQSLLANWKPVKVFGRVQKFNDLPAAGHLPIFSERAVAALRDLLEPHGELLPLTSDLGTYYAYNILTMADALDLNRSDIDWMEKPLQASTVRRYEFIEEKLAGLVIFRIPIEPTMAFVTDDFVRRVQDNKLHGFRFTKLWPLPTGVSWWDMRREQWDLEEKIGLPAGKRIKGNAVVIRLYLDESSLKPTAAQARETDVLTIQLAMPAPRTR